MKTLITILLLTFTFTGCNVTSAPDGEDEHIEYLQKVQKEDCENKESDKTDQANDCD